MCGSVHNDTVFQVVLMENADPGLDQGHFYNVDIIYFVILLKALDEISI